MQNIITLNLVVGSPELIKCMYSLPSGVAVIILMHGKGCSRAVRVIQTGCGAKRFLHKIEQCVTFGSCTPHMIFIASFHEMIHCHISLAGAVKEIPS